jgi:hypothetical protein
VDPYERGAVAAYIDFVGGDSDWIRKTGDYENSVDDSYWGTQDQLPPGYPQPPTGPGYPPPNYPQGNPQAPIEDFNAAAQAAANAAFQNTWGRQQPYVDKDREHLRTQLETQGIMLGNENYDTEMGKFNQSVNDQRTAAAQQALMQGDQLRHNLFADATAARQQGLSERYADMNAYNQARGQQVNDALLERNQNMNEMMQLSGGIPGMQMPMPNTSGQVQNIQAPNIAANYNNNYNNEMQQYSGLVGGLFDLGTAYMMK